jgi:segregation and condensation protein B
MDENKETVLAEDNPESEAVITETPTEARELVENVSDGSEMPVGRALNKGRRLKPDEDEPEGEEPHEKMSQEKAMRVLEAIMFANGDEVYYDQFAKIIGYTPKEAMKVVDAYAALYDTEAFPRGIKLVKYEKCCQLTTCPELGEYVTQMIGIRGEPQLSPAAMETLAIVAYNQPVTRAYIEQVRRVDSTRPITVLLDRELIEEKGRLEVIGRPRLFGTTQNFLRTFGITSLSELPSLDLFSVDM